MIHIIKFKSTIGNVLQKLGIMGVFVPIPRPGGDDCTQRFPEGMNPRCSGGSVSGL